ncbi:hypothetical protein ACJX0J_039933, partial [Zea mays]
MLYKNNYKQRIWLLILQLKEEIGFSQALEAARETPEDTSIASQSAQESFKVTYFLAIVDQAIAGMKRLLVSCLLQISCALWMIRHYFLNIQILMEKNCLWRCFPNIVIAYQILLIVPITQNIKGPKKFDDDAASMHKNTEIEIL